MSKTRAAALGAALLLGFSGIAGAQAPARPDHVGPRHGAGMRRGGGREDRFAKDLNLTASQKAQIKTIREKYMPQQMELRKAAQAVGGPPDEATRGKMMDLQSKQSAEIRAVLTADQQVVFDKNAADMKARMEARRNGSS